MNNKKKRSQKLKEELQNSKRLYAYSNDRRVTIAGVIKEEEKGKFIIALGLSKRRVGDIQLNKQAKTTATVRALRNPFDHYIVKPKRRMIEFENEHGKKTRRLETYYAALVREFRQDHVVIANKFSETLLPQFIQDLYNKGR